MRSRNQEQAALRRRAFTRLGLALVALLILGFAGFRHSTRAAALTKESLHGVPAYVGGPAQRPAVIVLQEWWVPSCLISCPPSRGTPWEFMNRGGCMLPYDRRVSCAVGGV